MLTYAWPTVALGLPDDRPKWFRQQQAALAVPQPWHELNASLHVTSFRSGAERLCKLTLCGRGDVVI